MSIKLFKGDDSDFADAREIAVTLNAPFDMIGYSAEFVLQGFRQRFTGLSSGTFTLRFTGRDTRHFSLGSCFGTLTLLDGQRRGKTLTNRIPFEVVNTVDTTESDEELTINVTVDSQNVEITFSSSTVGAETLGNKTETVRASASADHTKYPTEKAVALLGDTLVSKGSDTYSVTGFTDKKTLDLSDCTMADLCDLVGTLVQTMKDRGIIL